MKQKIRWLISENLNTYCFLHREIHSALSTAPYYVVVDRSAFVLKPLSHLLTIL